MMCSSGQSPALVIHHTSEPLSGWNWVSEIQQDRFNLTSNRCWCLQEGWGEDKTPLLVPHWPSDSGGWFSLATWVWKSNQVLSEISLTRSELQIFPHVKQMNNRVVLINQSSLKLSTDGSNELPFHEDFLKGKLTIYVDKKIILLNKNKWKKKPLPLSIPNTSLYA